MAWTVSKVNTVFGNKRAVILDMTADAATQAVDTGLAVVEGFSVGYKSMNSANPKIKPNVDASGTAANGKIACTGFTSGDALFVVVYGR